MNGNYNLRRKEIEKLKLLINMTVNNVNKPMNIQSFLYEWETYGTELRSRYGIEDIVFNQSQRAKSSPNQSECLDTARCWRDSVTARYEPYRNYFPLTCVQIILHNIDCDNGVIVV